MQWLCDVAEVFDELAIITNEPKEALYFTEVFHRCFPLSNCVHFSGINGDSTIRDDMTKVFDVRGCEVTFLEFAVPLVVAKAFEYEVNVMCMRFNVRRVDENVVEVYNYEIV